MKKLITLMLLFTVVAMLSFQACSKDEDKVVEEVIQLNKPPIADAGNDTAILIAICNQTATAILDGHLSYDPGINSFIRFLWKQVSGPTRAFDGVDSTRNIITVNNLVSGEYKFDLDVFDAKGLSASDSLIVNIINNTGYNNLELDLTPGFEFHDNLPYYGSVYDEFIISGSVSISNEPFDYNFYQISDSEVVNTQFTNYFNLNNLGGRFKSISGDCSVDFETLYIKGGGSFNGIIKITDGSAFEGCAIMMQELPPIQITGNMNVAAKTITMNLKGKIVL